LHSLSVVIPAYNEEKRLPGTLDAVLRFLRGREWEQVEVLVVDDGSTDATAALVQACSREHPEVRLLSNPGNRGKGYSVRHGMLAAQGEWRLFTDADLSAPIDELDSLFDAVVRHNAHIAIGSRALDRRLIGVHQSAFRETAGRFFNLLVQLGTGLRLWDTQCGFKLFRGDVAQEVFRRQRLERFGFDVEALFIAKLHGYRIVEVPVRWNHVEGTKVNMFSDSADMFLDIGRVRWNQLRRRYR
jgi:glycosyltransferase involved in cell wall biosynthesis